MTIQALLAALMLSVATGGLFAASNLTQNKGMSDDVFSAFRERTLVFFCIAAFLYLLSCMLAYISMVLFLTQPNLPSHEAKKMIGPMLYRLPQFAFIAGFIPLTIGLINYFLCMVDGHATATCAIVCYVSVLFPTALYLQRVLSISKYAGAQDDEEKSPSSVLLQV